MINHDKYKKCVDLLNSELVAALGCTEPIAIAYAAATARDYLENFPQKIKVHCSGNIIKNVKGVIVPTTGDLRGVATSAILGTIGGNAKKSLEVLSDVSEDHVKKTRELLNTDYCQIFLEKGVSNLYIKVEAFYHEDCVSVEIVDSHTNIVKIIKNESIVFEKDYISNGGKTNLKKELTINEIYQFANEVNIDDIRETIARQIEYNMNIAEEGMKNKYGANVGKTIVARYDRNIDNLAKAYTAAGSDARMGGSVMPVVINSGSGNQGMTVSIPVIVYAKALKVTEEKLYRALVFSNLIALYQKSGIGKLSAYCGAVSAACGSGAGIAYIHDESFEVISDSMKNALGNVSGIVCDGAKSSCAAKIASSVDAAIMGYHMAKNGDVFQAGEGLILDDLDATVSNICNLAKEGMKETDIEILEMMIAK